MKRPKRKFIKKQKNRGKKDYFIKETSQFLNDVEDAAIWILETNTPFSEFFALKKLTEFQDEINLLKARLELYPEIGETDEISGLRKYSIYEGRYSVKWIIQYSEYTVFLIALSDIRYQISKRA